MNANDYTNELNRLKKIFDKAKEDKLRNEQDLANQGKRIEELHEQCRALGVEPDDLESTIQETQEYLETAIKAIEALIPPEYFNVGSNMDTASSRLRPSLDGVRP